MGYFQPESDPGSDQGVVPTNSDSQTSGDKPISRLDEGARAEVSQIVGDAVQKALSQVQSGKDKSVADANKAIKSVQVEVTRLRNTLEARNLMTPEIKAALDETTNEDRWERMESQLASLLEKGTGSPPQGARIVYDEAFIAAGYDMATLSPEDQAFAINGVEQGTFKDQADLKNALVKRRASQQATKPTPDGSGIVSPGGGGASPDPSVKTVTDEYIKIYGEAANRGASKNELDRIKTDYKAKGALVDRVNWKSEPG